MSTLTVHKSRAFSLIELVIVVVIIGIIAAIAIPRMSRGATGANDGALASNLSTLRRALDLFQAEHNGTFPVLLTFSTQLTSYTNEGGTVSPDGTRTGGYIFGPYLRAVPLQTVGIGKGKDAIGTWATGGVDATKGWLYDAATGRIKANVTDTEADEGGKLYINY
jgi:prepilin-type N-terminal cleavage/methylation domain-containing protein